MTTPHLRHIAVCVDDFGIHAPSDAAILELALHKRISGISVLVDGMDVNVHRSALQQLAHQSSTMAVAVGLHLNLTESFQQSALAASKSSHVLNVPFTLIYPLKALIIRTQLVSWTAGYLGFNALQKQAIAQAISRQLDQFEALIGMPPAYIDGHEHVHAFPMIRSLLLAELTKRYGVTPQLPAIRVPAPASGTYLKRGVKSTVIAALGGYGLHHDLSRLAQVSNKNQVSSPAYTFNQDFAGVYDFTTQVAYAQRMQAWLDNLGDRGLIMAHPGQHPKTVYGAMARAMELAYFQSDAWLAALAQHRCVLIPFLNNFNF